MRMIPLALAAAGLLGAQAPDPGLERLFAAYYEDLLRWNPEIATSVGRSEYNDRWSDWTSAARSERLAKQARYLAELDGYDPGKLNQQDRLSRELLRYQLAQTIEMEPLQPLLRFGQLFGFHNRVFSTMEQMPARTVKDYENIVARLNGVAAYVDQNIEYEQEAIRSGITQPRNVVDLVIDQVKRQAAMTPEATPLLAAFRRLPDTIPAAERVRLAAAARQAYVTRTQPAWNRLSAWLSGVYAPKARASTSISAIPDGAVWYEKLVRATTTTNLTPGEIHEIGNRELDRIEAEMTKIARSAGFQGTLNEYEKQLGADPANRFKSKEEMVEYCRNVAMIAEPELPKLFKQLPRMPFGIKPIPTDREASTASHYQAPAIDGTRAGFFMLNTFEPDKQTRYPTDALVLHEGVPGHHLQLALQRELQGLPEFRRVYSTTAYVEGWALYAESLGEQMGVYDSPLKRFGQLSSERFRAVRLVVDTGLHAFGWSRERAIEFFVLHAPDESVAEVDRYISWPAQALGYKIGQLKIGELRHAAEQRWGARFDVRDFHDLVLRNGPLPLALLEAQVAAWRP